MKKKKNCTDWNDYFVNGSSGRKWHFSVYGIEEIHKMASTILHPSLSSTTTFQIPFNLFLAYKAIIHLLLYVVLFQILVNLGFLKESPFDSNEVVHRELHYLMKRFICFTFSSIAVSIAKQYFCANHCEQKPSAFRCNNVFTANNVNMWKKSAK